ERPGFQIYYPNRQYMSCGLRAKRIVNNYCGR
ncbi:hypothetical protein ACUOCP_51945, partial [Escherichia sp. R-CC3]